MTRMVHCVVLKKEAEGLTRQPWPGELGKRIYDNVSKEAWQRWLEHQTMLINEYPSKWGDCRADEGESPSAGHLSLAATYSRSTSSMRVCQPGPAARK